MNKYLEKLFIAIIILGAVLLGFYLGTTRQQQPIKEETSGSEIKVNVGDLEVPTQNTNEEQKAPQPQSVSGSVKKTEPKDEESRVLQPPALPD